MSRESMEEYIQGTREMVEELSPEHQDQMRRYAQRLKDPEFRRFMVKDFEENLERFCTAMETIYGT